MRHHASLKPNADGSLTLNSSYDPTLVALLKAKVPATGRAWDPGAKAWRFDPAYGQTVADIVKAIFDVDIYVPQVRISPTQIITAKKLEYLGLPKDKGGQYIASGYCDGGWNLIFHLDVLRAWFEPGIDKRPAGSSGSYYATLGVANDANETDIKKAYRRAAKTYHPDINREPDAAEQFKRINEAYQVLSDPIKRKRYEFGLTMTAVSSVSKTLVDQCTYWYPPLRCGWLLVEGLSQLGRFNVQKILSWEDITNDAGQTMVTHWPAGADMFVTAWA